MIEDDPDCRLQFCKTFSELIPNNRVITRLAVKERKMFGKQTKQV